VSVRDGTSGYSRPVPLALRSGVAAATAVLFLFGAEVAQAGGIGDIAEDPVAAVENALPNPEETELGAIVEDAAEAVEEVAGSADAEAVASDAKAVVDEVVADPTGTVENVVEQAKSTVGGATGIIKDVADKTPADTLVKDVTKALDPVVSSAGQSIVSRQEQATVSGVSAARSEAARPRSQGAPAASIQAPASPQALSAAAPGAAPTLGQPGSIAPSGSALIDRAPQVEAGWTRPIMQIQASRSTTPVQVSSAAPAAPFDPPPPGDQPATAASVGGATGAALLAVLFSALFLLAPSAGRLARPGPILVRAEPCLSLPERPG
jgi:hypothetical protein